jgi:hypothetical protein
MNTSIQHILRISTFHVHHAIEIHVTSICEINTKITFQN